MRFPGRLRTLGSGAVSLLAASSLLGCGRGGDGVPPVVQGSPQELNLMTPHLVAIAPARSPQRTVLRWWLDNQYALAGPAFRLFAPSVQLRLARSNFTDAVYTQFGPWSAHARPLVWRVHRSGPYATVEMTLQIRNQVSGSDRTVLSLEPAAFSLVLDHSGWRLADADFFLSELAALRSASARAAHEANPG